MQGVELTHHLGERLRQQPALLACCYLDSLQCCVLLCARSAARSRPRPAASWRTWTPMRKVC